MCRICGSQDWKTVDCCPTPLETGLAISKDDFKTAMVKIWGDSEPIPDYIVTSFYSDWMSGVPQTAEAYLRKCGE